MQHQTFIIRCFTYMLGTCPIYYVCAGIVFLFENYVKSYIRTDKKHTHTPKRRTHRAACLRLRYIWFIFYINEMSSRCCTELGALRGNSNFPCAESVHIRNITFCTRAFVIYAFHGEHTKNMGHGLTTTIIIPIRPANP